MAFQNIVRKRAYFQPAAVGSTETKALFRVKKGTRVLWATVTPVVNSATDTTSTVKLGDGNVTDRFITTSACDLETATAGTPITGDGAGIVAGGYMYSAADTIDVVYTHGTPGATNPKVLFEVALVNADLR